MSPAQLAYMCTRGGPPGKRPTKADLLKWVDTLDSAIEEMFKEMTNMEAENARLRALAGEK